MVTRWVPCFCCVQHVRILQLFLCCHVLDDIIKDLGKPNRIPVVFCGDLNSDEVSGSIQLLKNGSISKEHPDWSEGQPLPREIDDVVVGRTFVIKFFVECYQCAQDMRSVGTDFFWRDAELEEVDGCEDCSPVPDKQKFAADVHVDGLSCPSSSTSVHTEERRDHSHDAETKCSLGTGLELLLPQSLQLRDAYAACPLPFTNLCSTFCATLDHIYVGPAFEASPTYL